MLFHNYCLQIYIFMIIDVLQIIISLESTQKTFSLLSTLFVIFSLIVFVILNNVSPIKEVNIVY